MKEQFDAIQSSIMDTASKEMTKMGQNLISGLEGLSLNPTQKKAVASQIDAVVDSVEMFVGGKAKEVFGLIKKEIDKKLDGIDIIPAGLRKQISSMCKGSVDQLDKLVSDALSQVNKSSKEASGAILEQGVRVFKSTFDIIGAWLKGEKTREQAITGIKGAWTDAGQAVSKSFSEAKKSFVEKVGGQKVNSKDKSHSERVSENGEASVSRTR